jgi:hypothetical protein
MLAAGDGVAAERKRLLAMEMGRSSSAARMEVEWSTPASGAAGCVAGRGESDFWGGRAGCGKVHEMVFLATIVRPRTRGIRGFDPPGDAQHCPFM